MHRLRVLLPTRAARLRAALPLLLLLGLGGCVYPAAPYYGRPYAAPPVAVYPAPYYRPYGYGYGYGGWRRW